MQLDPDPKGAISLGPGFQIRKKGFKSMDKWRRIQYQPNQPLYPDRERVTGSREHIELSRKAAGEGMVLLKNENGVLPFARGTKVALFGKAGVDYVKGGGGSGDVTTAYVRNLWDGMKEKEKEGRVFLMPELEEFYRKNVEKQYGEGFVPGMTEEPELPEELLREARSFTDTAVISICRFSGEGWDRKAVFHEELDNFPEEERRQIERSSTLFERGDFYLSRAEEALVNTVKENFAKVVVVYREGSGFSFRRGTSG